MTDATSNKNESPSCMNRRQFLLAGGSTIALASLPGFSNSLTALEKKYPRKLVTHLSAIKSGELIQFTYPFDRTGNINFITKLDQRAGGGVGDDQDIVAFSNFCTHMGGPLQGSYKHEYKAIGPCPFHLTTFDLCRHGIVISGHATESLPQVVLEIENDRVYAVGMMGLIYGGRINTLES